MVTTRRPPGTLAAALLVARLEQRRRMRDRTALLVGIGAPLLMGALIGFALGGAHSFSATVAVVDADGSPLSVAVVEGLVAGIPPDSPLRLERVADEAAARRRLADESVGAVLVVPAGFGASLGASPLPLTVLTHPDGPITGGFARSVADGVAARIDAGRLGVTAALAGPRPPDPARLADEATRIAPAVTTTVETAGDPYRPTAYFAASMSVIFLFFTLGAGARSLLAEQVDGTLDRVRASPARDRSVLLGKTAATLAVGLVSMITVWLVTALLFRAPWGDPVAVLAVMAATVVAAAGLSSLITALATTDAQAEVLTGLLTFVLALLGGSFQRAATLPPVFERLALLTPNGWALRAFNRVGAAGGGVVDVAPSLAVLGAIGAVTYTAGVVLLRRRVVAR